MCTSVRVSLLDKNYFTFPRTTVVLYSFSLIYKMRFSKSPVTEIGSIVFSP